MEDALLSLGGATEDMDCIDILALRCQK